MRRYPVILFFAGVIINLIKTFYVMLFCIILKLSPFSIPPVIIYIILLLWLLWAIASQIRMIQILYKMADDNELVDKMFKDNNKGYQNIIDKVSEEIKKHDESIDVE